MKLNLDQIKINSFSQIHPKIPDLNISMKIRQQKEGLVLETQPQDDTNA